MGVSEGIAVVLVLLAAMYGCAQMIVNVARILLRPREPCVKLLLQFREWESVEQQIRYAKMLSKEWRIPLTVETKGMDEESYRIAQVLLAEEAW